ncbi:vWA domain-containing protein [Cellvibrio polysaccharolyticus]|uniref:VWA domain-containing protein n=1 Tax=Cellvibrio polysaccharolyticus TaxID=2082724 RepID=A0A928YTV5_9GAMM|nr:VWA domain-containing protein [Cellvibrio polysaccharolyticus]MBE8717267.1 VWA domain-containing protein [Cellvibrio polysaccharolyticus]
MLEFQFSWLLWLAPLPLLMYWVRPKKQEEVALRVPFFQQAMALQEEEGRKTRIRPLRYLALWTIWLSALLAAANPQWLGEPVSIQGSGRDLLLAVDISGSMQIEDMQLQGRAINRLTAIKLVVGNFVEGRRSDRLGLILFGSQAYLQAPLTYDRHTVGVLLQEAQIGFAGEQTAIGDAIGLAVKRLRSRPDNSRVLVLLTDGASTSGELTPQRAADLAKHENIKIYTIGFGADEMVVPGIFGNRRINPSEDLDEDTMRAVASATGGQYFRARNLEELDAIHKELDRLEPVEQDSRTFRPVRALFFWPLSVALILSLLFALAHAWQGRDTANNGEAAR